MSIDQIKGRSGRLVEVDENDRIPVSEFVATSAAAVTPSDEDDIAAGVTKALYIGGVGDLVVNLKGMPTTQSAKFAAVPAGTVLNIAAARVWATGTTATEIVALY